MDVAAPAHLGFAAPPVRAAVGRPAREALALTATGAGEALRAPAQGVAAVDAIVAATSRGKAAA